MEKYFATYTLKIIFLFSTVAWQILKHNNLYAIFQESGLHPEGSGKLMQNSG
jgi:hypothetical protein